MTFAGGTLSALGLNNVANTVNIPNTTAIFGGGNSVNLTGTINLTGLATLNPSNGLTTLSGLITGSGALAIAGTAGTVLLPNASTFTGGTYLSGGNLALGNAGALGSGIVSLAGGTLLDTSALTIANPVVLNGTTTLGGNNALNLAGTITLLTNSTLTVNNATTLSGLIGESGGSRTLMQGGFGTLTLSDPNNYFSGGVNLNAAVSNAPLGTLVVGNPTNAGAAGSLDFDRLRRNLQVGGAPSPSDQRRDAQRRHWSLGLLGGSNAHYLQRALQTLATGTTTTLLANTVNDIQRRHHWRHRVDQRTGRCRSWAATVTSELQPAPTPVATTVSGGTLDA